MARPSVIVFTLATVGAVAGLGYFHLNRTSADGESETTHDVVVPTSRVVSATPTEATVIAPTNDVGVDAPAEDQQLSTPQTDDDFSRWVAETQSNDAKTRATAIAALVNVPKAQSVPALERVLESGEPQVDRQIALRSLQTLALNDGDQDGVIRGVIRHAMYHSDDQTVSQSAQAMLEEIEATLASTDTEDSLASQQ
ncbi:MAG: hypothetical protein ABW171_02305 [Steroidobacter sp.]